MIDFGGPINALWVGIILGLSFAVMVYGAYNMVMIEVEKKARNEVKKKMDRHEDIYH